MNLNDVHTAYFVGIGGIGMSAIARYFRHLGVAVSGYDRTRTELTMALEAEGIPVHYQPDPQRIPAGLDLAVYTPAVPSTQAELVHLRERGVPLLKRAETLGLISRAKRAIAIAGTHGKTTTSILLTWLLREGNVDCTAFLGGIATDYNSNFVAGKSEWVVVEADEYDRSFLQLEPQIAVVLSVEPDHLDIYGSAERILDTGFRAFARQLRPGGTLWVNIRCEEALGLSPPPRTFGIEGGEARADNIRVDGGAFVFDLTLGDLTLNDLRLSLPGRHNVENATAAVAVALELGVAADDIRRALASFGGIKRRFERLVDAGGHVYIDDYAHHPSELRAAIGAARELYPGRQLTGIFQPHLYSRTRDFARGFGEALSGLDQLLLMDIYPAREEPIPGVTSDIILDGLRDTPVRRVTHASALSELKALPVDVLLTLGAGDIDRLRAPIAAWLRAKTDDPKTKRP